VGVKDARAEVADAPFLIMANQQARVRNLAKPKNIQTNLSFLVERWGRSRKLTLFLGLVD